MQPAVYAIATMDTKGEELAYVAERLAAVGVSVQTVDVGTLDPPTVQPTIGRQEVRQTAPDSTLLHSAAPAETQDRAGAITVMAAHLSAFLTDQANQGNVLGVIGLGGSGGTALITPALRALPIGLPKLMVSTVASGDVAPYVDCSDILMMYSVVDVAGLNRVSETILGNAAAAMAGMVQHPLPAVSDRPDTKPCLGMTMFGVTTPCVTRVRQRLEAKGWEPLVFHATGTGGRAMEKLVRSGFLSAVLDITTTEVADEIAGGIFPCGPHRFDATLTARLPMVLSLGALDMVNFGAIGTVPSRYRDRLLHRHNDQVTLMRTSPAECRQIGRWIADKLNRSQQEVRLLIPEGGLSLLDVPGQPFYDPVADASLFKALETHRDASAKWQLVRLPYQINAPDFADALVDHFDQLSTARLPFSGLS